MKKYFYILLILLLMPVLVNARTFTFNICKSGCEFTNLDQAFDSISDVPEPEAGEKIELIVNYTDNETYNDDFDFNGRDIESFSITINGNNTIFNNASNKFSNIESINLNNIIITTNRNINFSNINTINLNNVSLSADSTISFDNIHKFDYNNGSLMSNSSIYLIGILPESEAAFNSFINNKEYLNSVFNISNVNLNAGVLFAMNKININNCDLLGCLNFMATDAFLMNSNIHKAIIAGYMWPAGKVHIYSNNKTDNNILRQKYLGTYDTSVDMNKSGVMAELLWSDEFLESTGISSSANNAIYIYQDINESIKNNINIDKYESKFVNNYKNSIGYDDIKDLPIEWKSDNESIAKIENGVIIPVSAGRIDLVGTRGNDIYTIHLTVEKESLPEKIDKMTIKVPITGSKLKLWVLVVGGILLGIVGVCSYLLIKNKKH